MPTRKLGRTSVAPSVLGFGAAPLGGMYTLSSDADAIEAVQTALDAGIRYFDVAPHYGQGLAELRLGRGLSARPCAGCVVGTKVGRLLEPVEAAPALPMWPEALPFHTVYDVSAKGIRRSLDESRTRTGRRRFEITLLHDPDRYAEDDGATARLIGTAYRTLAALRAEQTTDAIGLGVNSADVCRIALDLGDWDCFLLAGTYSVLRQDDGGLLERCREAGVGVIIGGPFMSGALAGGTTWRYRPIPDTVAAEIVKLRAICCGHRVPIKAAALQFPLLHPAVAAVVVGMRAASEVRENVHALYHPIPSAFWQDLIAEGFIRSGSVAGSGSSDAW
jgi:D-threo-aldose 1-dehydrogenase